MEKKKKKLGKSLAGLFVVLAAGCAAVYVYGYGDIKQELQAQQNGQSSIEAGEGEKITYGRIVSVVGNEIKIKLVDNPVNQQTLREEQNREAPKTEAANGEISSGKTSNEEVPNGEMPDGELPNGEVPNELPNGETQNRGMPGGLVRDVEEQEGEEKEYQIPVGTEVETQLGATTTFSRLTGGELIAILQSEDSEEIIKIWIIG